MRTPVRIAAILLVTLICNSSVYGQAAQELRDWKPDPEKQRKYLPYLATRHGGFTGLESWKESNTILYYKELWYYCESFSVKRDYLNEGAPLDESIIDISRFEFHRHPTEPVTVELPGFKDALELLPLNALIHQPEYVR